MESIAFYALVLGLLTFTIGIIVNMTDNVATYAQFMSSRGNNSAQNSSHVSSLITTQVKNETLSAILTPAVNNFLASGPNIFKSSEDTKIIFNTKILNRVNNATQNVEGTDATSAIVGIEIGRVVKSIIADHNQSGFISIQTSSDCTSLPLNSVRCQNNLTIK